MEFTIYSFGGYLALCALIWKICEKADGFFSPEFKFELGLWISKLEPPEKVNTWPRHFAHWFDKVFGEKHWSWRCFFRSCLASLAGSVIVLILWMLFRPDEISVLTSEPAGFVIQLLIFTVICNFIPDYFSLLETRFIIKQMEKTQSVFRHVLWLGVDFFITLMITIILPFLYLLFVVETPFWASPESITVWNYIKEVVTLSGYVFYNYSPIPYYSIIFFTSFFTSIWIWFYVLSGVVIRLFSGWRFLKTTVELDQKPVSYLGFTTILLLTVACTVVWSMPEQTWGVRHEASVFDDGEAARMVRAKGYFSVNWSPDNKGVENRFELNENGKTVFDSTTGLTWQQSGSLDYLNYEKAVVYVDSLNEANYAGYSDWRLPTLEEAMTLMEPEKKNDLYVDAVFDSRQLWIWTSDKTSASRPWVVLFSNGYCIISNLLDLYYCVRAVR